MNHALIAMSGNAMPGHEPLWQDIMKDVYGVLRKDKLDDKDEQFLLKILDFNDRLQVNSQSEFPHSLSMENMLKSLATQALGKQAKKHLLKINEVRKTNPNISSIARDVIRKIIQANVISSREKIELEDNTFEIENVFGNGEATVRGQIFSLGIYCKTQPDQQPEVGEIWELTITGKISLLKKKEEK